MDLNRKIGGIGGEIHFRYRMMKDDVQIPSFLADYYGADASEDDGRPGTDPEDGKEEPDDGTPDGRYVFRCGGGQLVL